MWRRARDDHFDVRTPTPREAREAEIAKRRRGYFMLMLPCIALVLFGFFVPAPVPVRVVALAVAAVLPPLAAISGNARPPG
jgi:Na+/H+ antiporter NhaD/arsenite permease-like protein